MNTPTIQMTGIERAVQAAGSQMLLAIALKSRFPDKRHPSQQAVSQWVGQGYVPAARAKEVSTITGVPVTELLAPELRDLVS